MAWAHNRPCLWRWMHTWVGACAGLQWVMSMALREYALFCGWVGDGHMGERVPMPSCVRATVKSGVGLTRQWDSWRDTRCEAAVKTRPPPRKYAAAPKLPHLDRPHDVAQRRLIERGERRLKVREMFLLHLFLVHFLRGRQP